MLALIRNWGLEFSVRHPALCRIIRQLEVHTVIDSLEACWRSPILIGCLCFLFMIPVWLLKYGTATLHLHYLFQIINLGYAGWWTSTGLKLLHRAINVILLLKESGWCIWEHFNISIADTRVSQANPHLKLILALSLLQIVENCLSESFVAQEVLAFVEAMIRIWSCEEFLFFKHFG